MQGRIGTKWEGDEEQRGEGFSEGDEGKKGEMEERFGGRETDGGGDWSSPSLRTAVL